MLKTGYDLSKQEIIEKYSRLTQRRGLGKEFNLWILRHAGDLHGKRILDVGCGYGELLEEIASCYDCELYGVDFIDNRIDETLERLKDKVVIRNSDIGECLPFPDEHFDVVFSTETLEHLKNPDRCLAEIKRVLRKNGEIILTLPNATGYFPFNYLGAIIPNRWLRAKLLPYEHPLNTDQPIDTCYEYGELVDLLKRAGLRIVKVEGCAYFRYLQILPLVRVIYNIFVSIIRSGLSIIRAQRFAYHVLFLCRK